MAYSPNIRVLYKKLLRLYPRTFREQFGESMQQTFNDLFNEEKTQREGGRRSFVLWIFIETGIGIIEQRVLLVREIKLMKIILTSIKSPALISFLLLIPFLILEIVNRRNLDEGFPIPLFVILWLLPTVFIATLMPMVRTIRAGNSIVANPVVLLIRVVLMVFLVWMWVGIVIDQMPCFLGVPNCD